MLRFRSSTPKAEVQYAFDTLEQVRQGDYTVWQMVYDATAPQVHYRTRTNPQERTVNLKTLDFACGHAVQFTDIGAKPSAAGRLGFKALTEAAHRGYLEEFSAQPSLKRQFGDLTLQVEGLLLTLRTYTCVGR